MFVKEIAADTMPQGNDRPRERILHAGADVLSDRELLAVLIGSGIPGCNVFKLAGVVLAALEEDQFRSDPHRLMLIPGMGPAKVSQLTAALEFSRRVFAPRNYRIRHPADALPLLHHYADRPQEHFIVITLNGAHEVISVRVVSVGLVNRTLVHPREVFADAIKDRAVAVICAHNHPSGRVQPSGEDHAVTQSLQEAGDILGIRLLDHIVFAAGGHYSYLDHGML
ncbi:MAG: RadC family protein [Alkalispirochaeta sp.]